MQSCDVFSVGKFLEGHENPFAKLSAAEKPPPRSPLATPSRGRIIAVPARCDSARFVPGSARGNGVLRPRRLLSLAHQAALTVFVPVRETAAELGPRP